MLDYHEYNTSGNGYQGNGNGANPLSYDHLDGDWALFYKVARGFTKRVKPEDRQDFLHDLFLTMAKVKAKYQAIGKELTEAGLVRIACYDVADYWRKHFRRINGHDCGNCSKEQRRRCKEKDLYRECPKAIKIESLDRVIEDDNGDSTELHEMIADDNAVDLVARLDARLTLQGYPHKFVRIAYKKYSGLPLDEVERRYFNRQKQKAVKLQQKVLI
jgi:hypothetical protein